MTTTSTIDVWIPNAKPNPQARLRLFCFPHAGGGASTFRSWSDELPPEIDVCPIQLPGRENRLPEPPFTQLTLLLQTLARVLLPHLNSPFAVLGHSLGALISFEFARQLRRQYGLQPVHLFVCGSRAPQMPNRLPPTHQLSNAEFVAELRRLNCTPEPVLQNAELLELLLPTLRADFTTYENYAYSVEAPLDCPISAFGGLQDNLVSHDDLTAWCDQTRNVCALRMFQGDHFFLHSARTPILQAISQDLMQRLPDLEPGPVRSKS